MPTCSYTEPDLAARSTPDVLQVFADFEKKLAEGAGEGITKEEGCGEAAVSRARPCCVPLDARCCFCGRAH